jgi:hypothetical protein
MLICALSFCAQPAQATLITIQIEGVVDSVLDEGNYLEGKIKPGDAITGFYTYESTTPDSSPLDPVQGNYWHYTPPAGISLTVGGFDFKTDPTNVEFCVAVRNNNLSGDDVYWIHSDKNLFLSNGTPVDYISWSLKDHTSSALSSDALPTTFPILAYWQENLLRIYTDRSFIIDSHITYVIPEPVTIVLIVLGGLVLRKRR